MRRFIFLAAVVGSQLAAGCCSDRPYLPRLHSGWGCGSGSCGTGLLNRPVLDLPIIDRPLLNRPILSPHYGGVPAAAAPGYSVGDHGMPLPTYQPAPGYPMGYSGGVGYPAGGYPSGGDPGCVGCSGGNGHHVGSVGTPISYGPSGYPGHAGGAGGSGIPVVPAPMPMTMPSAMPGGVPHDSALLKMPTIVPPGSTSKRPEELARTSGGGK